jgi:hypothetical protein
MKTPRSGAIADRRRLYETQKTIAAQGILERTTPSKYSRAVWNKTFVAIMTGLFSLVSSEAVVPRPDTSRGNGNTAEGTEALSSNTTGQANTAIGVGALHKNTTGVGNTATGIAAFQQYIANRQAAIANMPNGPQKFYEQARLDEQILAEKRLEEQRAANALILLGQGMQNAAPIQAASQPRNIYVWHYGRY